MDKVYIFLFSLVASAVCYANPIRSSISSAGIDYEGLVENGIVPISYIESTGTQFIDTGIAINCRTDIIDCLLEVTTVKDYGAAFGVYESINGSGRFFGLRRNANQEVWQVLWGGMPTIALYLYTPYNIHYEYGRNTCSINDTVGSSQTNVEYTRTLYIFGLNTTGLNAANTIAMRLYSFSVARSNESILDLIPVRFLNEANKWEGAMLDLVSESLFRNQGTGEFIIGPDL